MDVLYCCLIISTLYLGTYNSQTFKIKAAMTNKKYDIVIVGAGISGIGMAYWLQKKCPTKKIAILEARDSIGGTWSLFQYPGVRSDSDMFTFGYKFKPWTNPQSLSSGEGILKYLKETIQENDLEKYIIYNHKMTSSNWSDHTKTWTLQVETPKGNREIACDFLSICTGYYDYKEAYKPTFKGEESFKGKIVQPQFWPKDLDSKDKKIVVIGSGATAVTLLPALANHGAAQVTMLQRSPTYVMNLPNYNEMFLRLQKYLPFKWAYKLTRWKNILLSMFLFGVSKLFPKWMKGKIIEGAAKQLPEGYPVEKHFNPKYNPWEQRLCVIPDGDLFKSIKAGKASVETASISHFTENGIALDSGKTLEADIIVLATGLKMQLLGGSQMSINNKPVETSQTMVYKGMLFSGIPNLIYAFGYTNNSWTLKVDLTANYLCKLINYMDRKKYDVVIAENQNSGSEEAFLNLSSGYIQRAKNILPKQGKKRPWRVYQNYVMDMLTTRFGSISDSALKFQSANKKI